MQGFGIKVRDAFAEGTTELYKKSGDQITEASLKSNSFLNLRFVLQSVFPLANTFLGTGQFIVLYKKGSFEIIPRGLFGSNISSYLGVRYAQIYSWAVLPSRLSEFIKQSKTAPLVIGDNNNIEDIYDRIQRNLEGNPD